MRTNGALPVILLIGFFFFGCAPKDQTENKETTTNPLLGQWATHVDGDPPSLVDCNRPELQFGEHYMYHRIDADGDPYEVNHPVSEYIISPQQIHVVLSEPTAFESWEFPDQSLRIDLVSEVQIKMQNPRFPDWNRYFIKRTKSHLPYSKDEAPTPPSDQPSVLPGIQPGRSLN